MRKTVLVILCVAVLFCGACKHKKKKSHTPAPTSTITAAVTVPTSPQTGNITISYRLIDPRTPTVNADVKVYYSKNGGNFVPATQGAGGDPITNLTTAASPGASHTFVWDSLVDLGIGSFNIVIKIVPYETGTTNMGTAGQTTSFQVINAEATITVGAKVFDPKMPNSSPLQVTYRVNPSGIDFVMTVKVVTATGGTEVVRLIDAQTKAGGTSHTTTWNGKNANAQYVDTGDYKLRIEATYQGLPAWTKEEAVHIVRLGVVGIQFLDNGADGAEYQMMYHIRNTSLYTYYAIPSNKPEWAIGKNSGDVADLDTNDGLPRVLPSPWTNLNSPPQDATDPAGVEDDNYNLPVCYKRASKPKFQLTIGSNAASNITANTQLGCNYPITGMPIRVIVDSATPETAGANENISPAGTVNFIANTTLPDAVKKNTITYTIRFEYQDGGTWHQISGYITTNHTVYTIFDKPKLHDSSTNPPYLPWVKCVDIVCGWINGPATESQICSIVVNKVNTFFGIQYDTVSGACWYTTGSLSLQTMKMSDFIEDYDANTFTKVNCSDCACLTSTFANTIGVDHKALILGYTTGSIPLNYMIAIGYSDWIKPFGGWFSYHAVATKDDGASISDACCTLDCDGTPGSAPYTPLLPVNEPYASYNAMLSSNPSSYGTYAKWRCGQQ